MSLFDKISSRGKDVAQKAKDLAEVTSLNSQIRAQEEQIRQTCQEIGQQYFEDNKEGGGSAYGEQMSRLAAAKETIEDLKRKINQIKGINTCPGCGADVPAKSSFCSSCGAKVAPIAWSEEGPAANPDVSEETLPPKTCPHCNATVEEDTQFCTECGQKLD